MAAAPVANRRPRPRPVPAAGPVLATHARLPGLVAGARNSESGTVGPPRVVTGREGSGRRRPRPPRCR